MYCDICRQFPHHPRCPNAPDPPVVYYCNMCNEEIREGDDYYDFGELKICYSCVKQAFRTAEVEE